MLHNNSFPQYLFLAITAICYLSFLWSVIGVFSLKNSRLNLLYNCLKIFSTLFWVLSVIIIMRSERIESINFVLGAIMNAFCLALFWWTRNHIKRLSFSTIFGKDIPESLVTTGPFFLMRHPFYTSYLFCYGSAAIVTQSIALGALFVVLVMIYFLAIKIEEAKFVKSDFLKEFVEYRQSTNALFPTLAKVSKRIRKKELVLKSGEAGTNLE